MAYNKTEQLVLELAEPIVKSCGLSVWDVEYKKEGKEYYLRVFIDKPEGVDINECEKVSRELSDILDEKDPIENAYYLEVCSAGIDRELKRESDFLAFLGHDIDIKLYAPIDGKKEFTATLLDFKDNKLFIESDGKKSELEKAKISKVRLTVKF